MSSDIFLACVRGESVEKFARTLFEEVFGRHAVAPAPGYLPKDFNYADGGTQVYGADDDEIDGLMFNHFGGDTFFDALHELALRTRSVIYWPDEGVWAAVAEPTTISLLPASFEREGPKAVCVVQNGRELQDVYYGRRRRRETGDPRRHRTDQTRRLTTGILTPANCKIRNMRISQFHIDIVL